MSNCNIKPLGDRVLLEICENTEVMKGGILIPDSAKEKPQEYRVVALGTGKNDDKGETDEEREAREKAEREANGGETNAEKEAREAQEREANGGETNAEKEAREQRELEEQEQRFREQQAMRLRHRAMRLRTEQELESLSY